jgi:hypothetical protein
LKNFLKNVPLFSKVSHVILGAGVDHSKYMLKSPEKNLNSSQSVLNTSSPNKRSTVIN